MNRKQIIVLGIVIFVFGGLYFGRHWLRDQWDYWNRPELPPPVTYTASEQPVADDAETMLPSGPPASVEGGYATSEHFSLESSPQTVKKEPPPAPDPLRADVEIPQEMNLAVPWISQAPHANWDYPYQEACEEASMIMVDQFYQKRSTRILPDEADEKILALVDYQNETYGEYKDTSAAETAQVIKDYYGYKDVRVLPFTSADDVKEILARGYPVIIPFWGKAVGNPNYRNGGPLYHMMVMKGYTADGKFITGDPGTRKGEDYVYPFDRIFEAAHDWNNGMVEVGDKVMIVALPNNPSE